MLDDVAILLVGESPREPLPDLTGTKEPTRPVKPEAGKHGRKRSGLVGERMIGHPALQGLRKSLRIDCCCLNGWVRFG